MPSISDFAPPAAHVTPRPTQCVRLFRPGRIPYRAAWDLQQAVARGRAEGSLEDCLFLLEHDPVYTIGTGGVEEHLLAGSEELRNSGTDVVRVDRGGDITYHGPGQLVGYPILDLRTYRQDLHWYLRLIEELLIGTIASFGIEGTRDPDFTGVWVGTEKIAAIGIHASRWVTTHGFALNVNTDLSAFDRIIPCGIFHRGVTSIGRLLGRRVPMEEVEEEAARQFSAAFRPVAGYPDSDPTTSFVHSMIERISCLTTANR